MNEELYLLIWFFKYFLVRYTALSINTLMKKENNQCLSLLCWSFIGFSITILMLLNQQEIISSIILGTFIVLADVFHEKDEYLLSALSIIFGTLFVLSTLSKSLIVTLITIISYVLIILAMKIQNIIDYLIDKYF